MSALLEVCRKRLGPSPRLYSFERQEELTGERPGWVAKDSHLWESESLQPKLLSRGRVGWGAFVQANSDLYRKGHADLPALVIYSHDPFFESEPGELQKIASALFALKGTTPDNPDMAEAADLVSCEDAFPGAKPVPEKLTGGRSVLMTCMVVHRKHLPDGLLTEQAVPILMLPEETPLVMVLPVEFWPSELILSWRRSIIQYQYQAPKPMLPHLAAEAVQSDGRLAEESALKPLREGAAPVEAVRRSLSFSEIRDAFQGMTGRAPVSFLRTLYILFITPVMLLLPLVYFGLIGCIGFGLVELTATELRSVTEEPWEEVETPEQKARRERVAERRARGAVFYAPGAGPKSSVTPYTGWALVPVVLIVAGAVGAIPLSFLLKPLFRSRSPRAAVELDPNREQILYQFVEQVCRSMKAPVPETIWVDCTTNASAGLRSGILSVLFGRRFQLTLGLPLVASLSAEELAGIIGHELGHFRQGFAMRAFHIISVTSSWLEEIIHRRDGLDDAADLFAGARAPGITFFGGLIKVLLFGIRLFFWLLVFVSRLLTFLLSRQDEYDADQQATLLVGSGYAKVLRRLPLFGFAERLAMVDLQESYTGDHALVADLPAYTAGKLKSLPGALRLDLQEEALAERCSIFDTHPALADRIERVELCNSPGVLRMDRPAVDLFRDFDGLSRDATEAFYKALLGDNYYPALKVGNADYEKLYASELVRRTPGEVRGLPA